jgi:hypothetical protein
MSKLKYPPVFRSAPRGEWFKNAIVGSSPDAGETYAAGFFEAAEAIAAQARDGSYKDRLFYPMCFLYRHALEVVLKERIKGVEELISARAYSEDELAGQVRVAPEVDEELEETHSLERLLGILERRLAVLQYTDVIPSDVRAAVIELHHRDLRGETFRYARIKGTGRQVFEKQECFDIEQIASRLGEAYQFLSWGVGGEVAAQLDQISDYLSERECSS